MDRERGALLAGPRGERPDQQRTGARARWQRGRGLGIGARRRPVDNGCSGGARHRGSGPRRSGSCSSAFGGVSMTARDGRFGVGANVDDFIGRDRNAVSGGRLEDGIPSPLRDSALSVPALDRAGREPELCGHWPDAAELLEYALHLRWRPIAVRFAHHNRTSDVRQSHFRRLDESRTTLAMDSDAIISALKRLGVPQIEIATAINRDRTAATKMLAGKRSVKIGEIPALQELIRKYEAERGDATAVRRAVPLEDQFTEGLLDDYVAVEVLPTFAGMGGGGTGDGDRKMALVPRSLVQDELRARPQDLIVVPVRGDSMEPNFFQGDHVLVDKRDRDPGQAGPFALWDGDAYVLKNVERLPRHGRLRVFSSNRCYSEHEFDPDEIQIVGRPVWFARRL